MKIRITETQYNNILKDQRNSRRTDIGKKMDSSLFDDSYDNLIGLPYFKFDGYDIWFESNGKGVTDDITNNILDSLKPSEIFNSYGEWKNSKWYYITEFPFSDKDWTWASFASRDGLQKGEKFKWHSTGHKKQEEGLFNKYLKNYGPFLVVDLTNK
jgi:hypothetical protein